MDAATRVQTLDEAVCLLHCTNVLRKGRSPTILPPGIGKILGETVAL